MAHTVTVMGRPMTREEIHARLVEIGRENARSGLSDGRVTDAAYLRAGLRELACQGCGSANHLHFHVRRGTGIPARFARCPYDTAARSPYDTEED